MIGIVMVADDKAVIVLPKNIVKYKRKVANHPSTSGLKNIAIQISVPLLTRLWIE